MVLVCYEDGGRLRSVIAASTTMVAFPQLRKARSQSTIPFPPWSPRYTDGAAEDLPVQLIKLTGGLVSPPFGHWTRHLTTLDDYMKVLPFIQFTSLNNAFALSSMGCTDDTTTTHKQFTYFYHTIYHTLQNHSLSDSVLISHNTITSPLESTTFTTSPRLTMVTASTDRTRRAAAREKQAKAAAAAAVRADSADAASPTAVDELDANSTTTADVNKDDTATAATNSEAKEMDVDQPEEKSAEEETTTDTNTFINEMNNPNESKDSPETTTTSPGSSPVKKRSKKSVLEQISTPKETAPKEKPTKSATKSASTSSKGKKKRSASTMKEDSNKEDNPIGDKTPSALKSTGKTTPKSALKKPSFKKPDHLHKRVIIEFNVDFKKPIFEQFEGDRCKAMVFAVTELLKNLLLADKTVWLENVTDPNAHWLGEGGTNVPTNMTMLCNFCAGLNPKVFQTKGSNNSNGDNLSNLGGPPRSGPKNQSVAYCNMMLSSIKDPMLLMSQVSFEWGQFGNFIRPKALQALETDSPFVCYFLYSLASKSTIVAELKLIFSAIQSKLLDSDEGYDIPMEYYSMDVPVFDLRLMVPKQPKSNTHKKIPPKWEGMKRHFHMEFEKRFVAFFKVLIDFGKKSNIFKDWWGPHVHITEVVDWESSPGDLKRAEKFAMKSMNYNASLSASDVDGFLNLNNPIKIFKGGKLIATLSGRECLQTFLKLDDDSSMIAEVHQIPGSSVAQLVYPNTKEAESAINNMMKHAGGYLLNVLRDQGVEEEFIWQLLKTYVEPPLVHTAEECSWDSEEKILLTREEQEEDKDDLEQQSWFLDIAEVQEEKKKASGKNGYAEKKALFNLDGENSLKTMHEKNDYEDVEVEEASLSSKQKEMRKKKHLAEEERLNSENVSTVGDEVEVEYSDNEEEEVVIMDDDVEMKDADGLQEEADDATSGEGQQLGDTPISGKVRFSDKDDGASTGSDEDSGIEDVTPKAGGTASDAGDHQSSRGTGSQG